MPTIVSASRSTKWRGEIERENVPPLFLSLKIHFASKPHGFFKKRTKIVNKSEIWPTWPSLAFRRLVLALNFVLFTYAYR